MKKTLIIALCCITVLFAACKKEKPYEKFVGNYKGDAIADITLNATGGIFDFEHDLEGITLPIKINLSPGKSDNQVILTYTNDDIDEVYQTTGTIDKDFVDFEPITTNVTIEGNTVNTTLDLEGNLVETILSLSGTLNGSGTLPGNEGVSIPFTAKGKVKAELEKVVTNE